MFLPVSGTKRCKPEQRNICLFLHIVGVLPASDFRHAGKNFQIVVVTLFGDGSRINCFTNSTAGIVYVLAVAEATVADKLAKFDKTVGNLFWFQVPKAKLTHSGESIMSEPLGR